MNKWKKGRGVGETGSAERHELYGRRSRPGFTAFTAIPGAES